MAKKTAYVLSVLLFAALLGTGAKANTLTAASCSTADVQAAVNLATDGDTVQIPNGTCTWTTGISTTKQIWIRAQNYTATPMGTLTRNVKIINNSTTVPLIVMTSGNSFHIRISGIYFAEGTAVAVNHVNLLGSGTQVPMLDDDTFEVANRFGNEPGVAAFAWQSLGGLMWNAYWIGVGGGTGGQCCPEGASLYINSPRSWYTNDTLGTQDTGGNQNVYIESSTLMNFGQSPDCDNNCRFVIRYSILNGLSGLTHGFTSAFGGRQYEYYNNTLETTTTNRNVAGRYFWARAGIGVIHDNSVAYQNQGYNAPILFDSIVECSPGVSCPNGGPPLYPTSRQVGWSCNPCGGTQATSTDVIDPVYLWNNCQAGHAPPCTGDSTWGTSSAYYIQLNREIYVDSGAKPGYAPYPYPHPLRGSSGSPPAPPTNPTAVVH